MKRKLTIFTFFLNIDFFTYFQLILSKQNKTTVFSSLLCISISKDFFSSIYCTFDKFLKRSIGFLYIIIRS